LTKYEQENGFLVFSGPNGDGIPAKGANGTN
jgi:hypothetical protein